MRVTTFTRAPDPRTGVRMVRRCFSRAGLSCARDDAENRAWPRSARSGSSTSGPSMLSGPAVGPLAGRSPAARVRPVSGAGRVCSRSARRHEAGPMPGFAGRVLDTGEELDAVWAPDGQSIVFAATTDLNQSAHATSHTDLFQVRASGGEPTQLSSGGVTYEHPHFAADGRTIYFSATADADQIYAHERIASAPWPWDGKPKVVTSGFDRSVASWAVSGDGRSIYLTAEDAGLEKLYRVPHPAARPGKRSSRSAASTPALACVAIPASPVILSNWASATEPAEIVRIDLATGSHRRLTSFAVDQAAALSWQPLQHFWFTSSRGRRIHNLIALPPRVRRLAQVSAARRDSWRSGQMWRDQITLRWNYHLLASPGYVVLLTNYTGSTGFAVRSRHQLDPFEGPASEYGRRRGHSALSLIDGSRQAARVARWTSRELAGGDDDEVKAISVTPGWPTPIAVGYERRHLPTATDGGRSSRKRRRPGAIRIQFAARRISNADPLLGRRARLPGAAEQHAGDAERPLQRMRCLAGFWCGRTPITGFWTAMTAGASTKKCMRGSHAG